MAVLGFLLSTVYVVIVTRLIIVGLDCYDNAPLEVQEAPYWMFVTSVIFNAVTFPIGFTIFMLTAGVQDGE